MLAHAARLCFFAGSIALAGSPAFAADDWTTYAHDQRRTGFERQPTGIGPASAGRLGLRWAAALGERAMASPIVADGFVFVATNAGNLIALRASDGGVAWRRHLGPDIRATPTLDGGLLLVGIYGVETPRPRDAALVAVDARSGNVRWRLPLPGVERSEPIALNGIVYAAIAGGDREQGCVNGRIVAVDERSGRRLPQTWYTSARPQDGGGIWSPLSTDGAALYFGTGNTCADDGDQNAIVSLTPALKRRWTVPAIAPDGSDQDVGGGVALVGPNAYAKGKSGYLYAIDRQTGALRWKQLVGAQNASSGGQGPPTGDGTMLMTNTGDGSTRDPNGTEAVGFSLAGRVLYRIAQTSSSPSLTAAFVPGVGFAAHDRSLTAFDPQTGTKLWSDATADGFYGMPAVVPSGVYAVDKSGNVYAWSLGAEHALLPNGPPRRLGDTAPPPGMSRKRVALASLATLAGLALVAPLIGKLGRRLRRTRPSS